MENLALSKETMDDLGSRFIINVPEEEKKDLVRICFQIELAHWYYLDFHCKNNSSLKKIGMKEFTYCMFSHISFLKRYVKKVDEVIDLWKEYKSAVPTHGAIILDEDFSHVLLVQGYYAKSSWGFPKGKVNEEEEPMHCAIREVMEETGFDIKRMVDPNTYLESTINDQVVRLYLVSGVPRSTKFRPHTRCEIRAVEWFPICDVPSNRKDMSTKLKNGLGPNNFYMVMPFMKRLRNWIAEKQQKVAPPPIKHAQSPQLQQNPRRQRLKSQGEPDSGKGKKQQQQQQFTQVFKTQTEAQDVSPFRQFRGPVTPNQSRVQRVNGRGKAGSGSAAKRQLYANGDGDLMTASNFDAPFKLNYSDNGDIIFTAPSWINFHLDQERLMRAIMS